MLLILPRTWAADPVFIDQFKKLDSTAREKIIQQASPEQTDELKKIDLHMDLLLRWHGEEGLRIAKESQVSKVRGLGDLEMFFKIQSQVWDAYVSAALEANKKAGMPRETQIAAEEKFVNERDAFRNRFPAIHSLILNIAASPDALRLDKRAGQLAEQWSIRMLTNSERSYRPVTKTEWMEMDQQAEQILQEIKKLPKLSFEELQKELGAVTDDKVRSMGFIRPLYLPPLPPSQTAPPFSSGQFNDSER